VGEPHNERGLKAAAGGEDLYPQRSCNLPVWRPITDLGRARGVGVNLKTFGFSAFLKLLSMNDKPRRSELRRRFRPAESSSGYDYHNSFRVRARRYLLDGEPMPDVLASTSTITRLSERLSAVAALQRLEKWRAAMPGTIFGFEPVVFESPAKLFRVKFEPDFGLRVHGQNTAFHLWNTQTPNLAPGRTYAALALVADAYQGHEDAPDDVAVLSVREPPTAFLLSSVMVPSALVASIVDDLEDIIEDTLTPPPPPDDRPIT
jgi:hypothetical protein